METETKNDKSGAATAASATKDSPSAFALAEQIANLLKGHSKTLQKEALNVFACTLGLRVVPIGLSIGSRQPVDANKKKDDTKAKAEGKVQNTKTKAPYKDTEEWKGMTKERNAIVAQLKIAEEATKPTLVDSLRQIESTIRSFRDNFQVKRP